MRQLREVIIHCSDSTFGSAALIDGWHRERGWDCIGYHYVICNGTQTKGAAYDPELDGIVEFGRPIETIGAHTKGHNVHSIGICLIGIRQFTDPQLIALQRLLLQLMDRYGLLLEDVHCHHEYNAAKTCPNLTAELIRGLVRGGVHTPEPVPEES